MPPTANVLRHGHKEQGNRIQAGHPRIVASKSAGVEVDAGAESRATRGEAGSTSQNFLWTRNPIRLIAPLLPKSLALPPLQVPALFLEASLGKGSGLMQSPCP